MKLIKSISNYINEPEYKITIINNSININNYVSIDSFSSEKIIIKYDKGFTTIYGNNLVVSRMLDNEINITGHIHRIELG